MSRWPLSPFEIASYDNPETIRLRKFATGTHLALEALRPKRGRSPREAVWSKGPATLYRYRSDAEGLHRVPILLVYAHILKPYVLDLVPGNSFVEHLLAENFDTYLLDWGIPGPEDRGMSIENYVLDLLPEAVERLREESGTGEYTLFGYCMGGTLAAMYAALSPGASPRNLVLLATPVDFAPEEPGLAGLWTLWSRRSEWWFDPDLLVDASGNVPEDAHKRLVGAGTSAIRPAAELYAALAADTMPESWLAISEWVDDGTPFPAQAFRQWVRDFYQRNRLAKGQLELRGRRVDLSGIEAPLLNIAGKKDVICPPSQSRPVMDLVGSRDKDFFVLDAGHVGLMASAEAKHRLWPRITDWLIPRSGET